MCSLFWLEDVTAHDDYAGLARVADALSTPIAGGEYVYGIVPFRHMLEARSVDIVMIDLVRVGGITPWMKIAGMAEAFNVPVVSHVLPELHVHLIAAIPNGLTVEYMPWSMALWEEIPVMEKGELVVPAKPGLGLKFDQGVIKRYGVESCTRPVITPHGEERKFLNPLPALRGMVREGQRDRCYTSSLRCMRRYGMLTTLRDVLTSITIGPLPARNS